MSFPKIQTCKVKKAILAKTVKTVNQIFIKKFYRFKFLSFTQRLKTELGITFLKGDFQDFINTER
jgi:hypothetical protein